MSSYDHNLKKLVGKKVVAIYMNDEYLLMGFDDGTYQAWSVEGDCCSHSYFYDFHGVTKLLDNGPIIEVGEVDLVPGDPGYYDDADENERRKQAWIAEHPGEDPDDNRWDWYTYDDCIQVYGYKLITEHAIFGYQTSVFSFRNSSNGYYGGWMYEVSPSKLPVLPLLTEDFLGD